LADFSVRENPAELFGCRGDGITMKFECLKAWASLPGQLRCRGELYIPTVIHHLGFEVGSGGSLYRNIRAGSRPYSVEDIFRLLRNDVIFAHPFKDIDQRQVVYKAILKRAAEWQK